MTKPHPSLLVAPPEIMLQVLKQDMNAEDHAKLTETLQSIQQLQNTSRLILSSVASLVPSPADPTGILERNITFASPELVNASETIKQQATRMNQLLTRRLQNKMREVIKSAEEAVSQQVAIPMPAASRPAAFGGVMEELTRKFQRSFGQASTPAPTPVTSQPAEDDDDYPDTDPMEWEDASPSPSPPPRRKVRFAPPPEPSVKAEEQSSSSLSGVMPGQEQVGAVGRSPPEVWVAPGFFFAASGQVQMSRKPPTPPRSASPEEHDPLLKYPKRLLGEYHDRPEVKRRR
ncbi:hypothetical protein K491DRAFT_103083 [Lophiostoma macrostomum CBS 122681]|uniref:Uncharacterized protein n=1 Tax=Lophiostoma macrostomum CBS 122681 TaxID=1314788 RepID=A0A6A6SU68_9PLEO|nr:hypothetical protein K491DRAFT_103083 [Lophiostoma macrostomum CBS 122681]